MSLLRKVVKQNKIREKWSRKKEEIERKKVPCPICGAPTIGDIRWYGKHTRKPGWICTEGGSLHFLINKANEIQEQFRETEGESLNLEVLDVREANIPVT